MIRWSAFQLSKSLDEIEKLVDEAEPLLKQLQQKATETAKLPNLAGYISQPLETFSYKIEGFLDYLHHRPDSISYPVPKGHDTKDSLSQRGTPLSTVLQLWDGEEQKARKSMGEG